ncbi:phytanoyl-CoA dioxygenase [Capsaspora owczarzaki ATCC 30864]|uniref:Phytanoyl-CoA dioxygenase n=1 Tax=Capsaspora owczarzaki (strain ATCC 30864) TaxID=595528 RepID=A0A0D2U2K1_CAPO3|nr:phytanoyl-CoA dioxygenase [Capsaspora owczarzaki ATCC 30864]KJE89426.1 phytanoyl-CoA dioxygenase [Capsaspora owczarzaki ATCC 30864]|eukprot:XP_004365766.2 phytanoyl-CoA dioxygenase [Capsaspora owczarzaki ATCC 30864]
MLCSRLLPSLLSRSARELSTVPVTRNNPPRCTMAAAMLARYTSAAPEPQSLATNQQSAPAHRRVQLDVPTADMKREFAEQGFLKVPGVISREFCAELNERIDRCFTGRFETGHYPDEWYWRAEMSLPDVTRHMCNIWKSDRLVASMVLSREVARFAAGLMNFDGARIGNDSVWVKPPNGTEITFHTDAFYVPYPMITCWLTLTDVSEANGTLQYIPGSHRWPKTAAIDRDAFHAPTSSYLSPAYEAAHAAGVDASTIKVESVELPAGSIVFHHGDMWHGSCKNTTSERWRRSLGIHLIPHTSRFGQGDGYIYGRYRKAGDDSMDPAFFPILWSKDGQRSATIKSHVGYD